MAKEIEKMKFPEIEWKVPEVGKDIQRVVLKSGAVLFLEEEKKLPIIEISIILKKSGPPYLEDGEYLVQRLFYEMLIKGGTEKYKPDEIVKILEDNAIDISTSDEGDFYRINISFLSEIKEIALPIIEEILFHPRFDEGIMKVEKERVLDNFKREMEDPSEVLFYLFYRVLYPENPASRFANINKLKELKRERLFEIHKTFIKPDNMIISIIGDFNIDEFLKDMENLFKDKYNNEYKIPELKPFKPMEKGKVFFYDMKIPQGYILILHEGERGYSDDYFDLLIMNDILGSGGFTSRIVSKVRNEKGLAYSTWGSYIKRSLFKGYFEAFCATKSGSVNDAIKYIIDEVKRIKEEKVKEEELKIAKESFINSAISSFGNPYNFIRMVSRLEFYNFPLDFYSKYVEKTKEVNIEGVFNAANKYLKPDDFSIIIVGDKSKIDTLKIKGFGELKFIQLEY